MLHYTQTIGYTTLWPHCMGPVQNRSLMRQIHSNGFWSHSECLVTTLFHALCATSLRGRDHLIFGQVRLSRRLLEMCVATYRDLIVCRLRGLTRVLKGKCGSLLCSCSVRLYIWFIKQESNFVCGLTFSELVGRSPPSFIFQST